VREQDWLCVLCKGIEDDYAGQLEDKYGDREPHRKPKVEVCSLIFHLSVDFEGQGRPFECKGADPEEIGNSAVIE